MKSRLLLIWVFWVLLLAACVQGDFGKFDPKQEKLSNEELLAGLKTLNVEEIKTKADLGEPAAQNDLGLLYIFGIGVPQDHHQAVSWFRSAAEKEEPFAMNNLAICYLKGINGISRNHVEAHKWLNLAISQAGRSHVDLTSAGFSEIMKSIEYHWYWTVRKKLSKAHAAARAWYEAKHGSLDPMPEDSLYLAADRGDLYSQVNMAQRFHFGHDVPQNNILAHKWYSLCWGRDSRCQYKIMVESRMTKEDIAEGERLAQQWRETHK